MGFGIKDLMEDDKLTPDQEQRYEQVFNKFDADKSGRIDRDELDKALQACGFSLGPYQLRLVMAFTDLDGTRTLPKAEFKYFMGRLSKQKRAFLSRDTAKKGKLEKDQLAAMLKDLKYNFSDRQIQMLYPMVDRDKDGSIDKEEWLIFATFLQFCKLDFLNADTDANGFLDAKEAAAHLHKLLGKKEGEITSAFIGKVISMVDVNKDGKLDYEEFAVMAAMAKLQQK